MGRKANNLTEEQRKEQRRRKSREFYHGHPEERRNRKKYEDVTVVVKKCSKCGQTKHWTEFSRNRTSQTGLYSSCKSCCSETWKLAHPSVREIRRLLALGVSGGDVARRLGIANRPVSKIKQGKSSVDNSITVKAGGMQGGDVLSAESELV